MFFDNEALMMFAQATEGDFTVGKEKLDAVAHELAMGWLHEGKDPNNTYITKEACNKFGFDFNILLCEEVDYLADKIEKELDKHANN